MLDYRVHASHCLGCGERAISLKTATTWMEMLQLVLYYAYPSICGFGILTGLLNILVIARQVKSSNDSYLLGLIISSTMLLLCGLFLWLPLYIGHYNIYEQMHGYFVSINDWFWFTSLWLILVMCLERCLSLTQNRTHSMCTPVQACVCTVMVYCVCLVSAMPRFWEFTVTEVVHPNNKNETILISEISDTARTPEYRVMYFWYITSITVFLPLPVLLVLTCLLSQATKNSHQTKTKRRLSANSYMNQGTSQVLTRKACEQINLSNLFISFIVFYLLFTSPKILVELLPRITIGILDTDSALYHTLHDLFELIFYLNFSIYFLLFLAYHTKYRKALKVICCCQCNQSKKKKNYY
jgi:hypothetical protein